MTRHSRLLPVPDAETLLGARIDGVYIRLHGIHRDFLVDYQELRLLAPPGLEQRNGLLVEVIQGEHVPRRLRFCDVRDFECSGLFEGLAKLPLEHEVRSVRGVLHWAPGVGPGQFFFLHGSSEPARLKLSPKRIFIEEGPGDSQPVTIERDWSPAPSFGIGMIPRPAHLHQQFGGDPITIHLGTRSHNRRLFIGDIDMQAQGRPQVDAVLNLSEQPNPWSISNADRWSIKGESRAGMNLAEIQEEASWVLERLRAGQRVLVHCTAGMNRSATVCCAVLILLEGVSAEAALERVRQYHPIARPDSYHWLRLRWLAQSHLLSNRV